MRLPIFIAVLFTIVLFSNTACQKDNPNNVPTDSAKPLISKVKVEQPSPYDPVICTLTIEYDIANRKITVYPDSFIPGIGDVQSRTYFFDSNGYLTGFEDVTNTSTIKPSCSII